MNCDERTDHEAQRTTRRRTSHHALCRAQQADQRGRRDSDTDGRIRQPTTGQEDLVPATAGQPLMPPGVPRPQRRAGLPGRAPAPPLQRRRQDQIVDHGRTAGRIARHDDVPHDRAGRGVHRHHLPVHCRRCRRCSPRRLPVDARCVDRRDGDHAVGRRGAASARRARSTSVGPSDVRLSLLDADQRLPRAAHRCRCRGRRPGRPLSRSRPRCAGSCVLFDVHQQRVDQVVVEDVVRDDLVGTSRARRSHVERHLRLSGRGSAPDGCSRSGTPACRGTVPGSRCPSRCGRAASIARAGTTRRRRSSLGLCPHVARRRVDGVELPHHLAGLLVERVRRGRRPS